MIKIIKGFGVLLMSSIILLAICFFIPKGAIAACNPAECEGNSECSVGSNCVGGCCRDPSPGEVTDPCILDPRECLGDEWQARPVWNCAPSGVANWEDIIYDHRCESRCAPSAQNCETCCTGDACDIYPSGCRWDFEIRDWVCNSRHRRASCVPACTSPSNVTTTRLSSTNMRVTWTPGTGGTSQALYVGENKAEVEANCPGISSPACVVKRENLAADDTTEDTGSVLAESTVYYVRVVTTGSCTAASPTQIYVSSCELSPNNNPTVMNPDSTQEFTTLVNSSAEIDNVTYAVTDPLVIFAIPLTDANGVDGYKTTVTALSLGDSTLSSNVIIDGASACNDSTLVRVSPPGAWWQVMDSDIQTNSTLRSILPLGEMFGLPGNGGWPGVPAYGETAGFGSGSVSDTGWIAESMATGQRIYNYAYFDSKIPESIEPLIKPVSSQADLSGATADSGGYTWYKFSGLGTDLTIDSALNIGSDKVILLIENANLNINADISLLNGFFLVVVEGQINIDPSVTDIQGLYAADGVISTGTLGLDGNGIGQDQPLSVTGSMASYAGISLDRNLADNSVPAEFFEYAPGQIYLFPTILGVRKINWKEVAP